MTIKPHRAYGKMGSPPDIPGNATVLFKLELLSFTKKADVSEKRDGSVLKHVVHEGEGGTDVFSLPNKRCDIYYSYKLRLPYDGTVEPLDEDDDAEWLAEDAEHGTPVGLRLGLETMRRGERARFTMYADCHGVRGLPDLGLRPRDRIVYEVKMKCWVESVDVVRDKKGAVVKRIMKAIHHTKSDPPDEFDRVRVQGHVSLSDAPDVVVAVLGDRDDFDNSYATWKPGQENGDSTSLQRECSARARFKNSTHASRALREMIARPKISRNEWKTTEIGAFEVGNFAPFSCPGGSSATPASARS